MIAKIEERPPAKRKASREDVGSCDGERVGRHIVRVRSRGVVPQKSQRLESALRTPTRREVAVRGLQTEPVAKAPCTPRPPGLEQNPTEATPTVQRKAVSSGVDCKGARTVFETIAANTAQVRKSRAWRTTGHRWIGIRVLRVQAATRTDTCGLITKWSPAQSQDQALWHMVHDNGTGENLNEQEALAAANAYTLLMSFKCN